MTHWQPSPHDSDTVTHDVHHDLHEIGASEPASEVSHAPPQVLPLHVFEVPASLAHRITAEQRHKLETHGSLFYIKTAGALHHLVLIEKFMDSGMSFDDADSAACGVGSTGTMSLTAAIPFTHDLEPMTKASEPPSFGHPGRVEVLAHHLTDGPRNALEEYAFLSSASTSGPKKLMHHLAGIEKEFMDKGYTIDATDSAVTLETADEGPGFPVHID